MILLGDVDVHPDVGPFLRWAGGKSWLVPTLVPEMLDAWTSRRGRYYEPFLGGGAVLIQMSAHVHCVGGDLNASLINAWQWLRDTPEEVAKTLTGIVDQYGDDKAGYLRVRTRFNSVGAHVSRWDAAAFLYLNALCFNGLWRVNKDGKFNVPYGNRTRRHIPSAGRIEAVGYVLRRGWRPTPDTSPWTVFLHAPATQLISEAQAGDIIYADPPYWGTFADYHKSDFGPAEQAALAIALEAAANRGARIWASNSNVPEIRTLYSWASIEEITEPRRISANGDRTGAACVLIRA